MKLKGERIQILYEIALSIGNSLNLNTMFEESLSAIKKKLNCTAVGVHTFGRSPKRKFYIERIYSIPGELDPIDAYQMALQRVLTITNDEKLTGFVGKLPISGKCGSSSYFHIFNLPTYGVLILTKDGEDIDPLILKLINPLLLKLANACNACSQERGLQVSERQYRDIFNSASDSFIIFDYDGCIIETNPHACGMFGYDYDEFVNLSHKDLVPPQYFNYFDQFKQVVTKTGHFHIESVYIRKNGSLFNAEIRGSKIEYNGHPHLLAVLRDITELKMIQATLTAEKERLAITLRSIGDGVITTDIDGNVITMNNASEELTGWSHKKAMGRSISKVFRIVNGSTKEIIDNPIERVLQRGRILDPKHDIILFSREGKQHYISINTAPLRDIENSIVGIILVFSDISEKKRLENELLKSIKLESLGILAGGIAHDFNNLLTGILGNINISTLDLNPRDKLYKRLKQAEKASLRAKDLTHQLLTFSTGGSPVKKDVSIKNVLRESMGFILSGTSAELDLSVPENLHPVNVDQGQIAQVFQNIAINAHQAMPNGGTIFVRAKKVTITESQEIPLNDGEYLKISIKDTGEGIPRKDLEKIFDPYFSTKQEGSGLGLATAYSIIKMHDGYIEVQSDVKRGTTFFIYLPVSDVETSKGKSEKKPEKKSLKSKKIRRILLMDDEELIRNVAKDMIEEMGCEVDFALDGEEAIELFIKSIEEKNPYNLVIMDLTIPGGMGGREAIESLLEIDPKIIAIVSSGYSTDPVMSDFKKYGFEGVLQKPFKFEELKEILERFND